MEYCAITRTGQMTFQTDFLEWLNANRTAFLPLTIRTRHFRNDLRIYIAGLNPDLIIRVKEHEICVDLRLKETWYDHILRKERSPEMLPDGWVSAWSYERPEILTEGKYRTVRDLRHEHLYQAFLAWCRDTLIPAAYIEVSGIGNGTTWIRLCREMNDQEGAAIVAQLSEVRRVDGTRVFSRTRTHLEYRPLWT